jgi:hypothetical protein
MEVVLLWISCVALRAYFAHFDVSILNELTNNVIFALDVHSPLAGPMIHCIGDSSHIDIIELHVVYDARNCWVLVQPNPVKP